MRFLRGLLGGLLWLLACIVGLVGAIACATLILLPIGIPLLGLARRLFGYSVRLFAPAALAHPTKEPKRRRHKARRVLADKKPSIELDVAGARKKWHSFFKRQRKRIA